MSELLYPDRPRSWSLLHTLPPRSSIRVSPVSPCGWDLPQSWLKRSTVSFPERSSMQTRNTRQFNYILTDSNWPSHGLLNSLSAAWQVVHQKRCNTSSVPCRTHRKLKKKKKINQAAELGKRELYQGSIKWRGFQELDEAILGGDVKHLTAFSMQTEKTNVLEGH